jgi:hypothetical protein
MGGGRKCDERYFKAIVFLHIGRKATLPRASGCYGCAGCFFWCCEYGRPNCVAWLKFRCDEILSTI